MSDPLFEVETIAQGSGSVEPVFARHETFHPRYGWLKKGFDAAREHPDVFIRPDATTILGVGKNMVRAIRYWCNAYKVLYEAPNPERPRLRDAHPTAFGTSLLAEDGWDPYLEDRGSLWLLHWQLLRPVCIAPSWFAAFYALPGVEFTDESLLAHIRSYCDGQDGWPAPVSNSMKKDARCLLRMFADVTSGRDLAEDSIDSPFAELELIRQTAGDRRHYRFGLGRKGDLPSEVVAFACLDFASVERDSAMISVSHLAQAPGAPGGAFKLTEKALAESLAEFCESEERLVMADVAGAAQLVLGDDPAELASSILDRYFRSGRNAEKTATALVA